MRTLCASGLVALVATLPLRADAPAAAVVRDTWEAAYLEGGKAGYVHTEVRRTGAPDRPVFRSTVEMELSVRRFNDIVRLRMQTGTEETADGRVTAVSMTQELGKDQQLIMRGLVEGDVLHVRVNGAGRHLDKRIPWNDKVVGLYRQESLFRERHVKPGDEFSYQSYEPTVTAVITTRVSVKDYEDVTLPGAPRPTRLLRVEARGDRIAGFQLPPMTLWLDQDYTPVRSQTEIPGLGRLTLYRTTRAAARGAAPVVRMTDIGFSQLVRLNRRIPRPYDTRRVVYRVRVAGDEDAATSFARDARQEVQNVHGDTFELRVRAAPQDPEPIEHPARVGREYLKSCYFLNCEDSRVREHARHAVGREADPWEKARRIERWVHDHMENKNFTEALATADHVARTLEGDCTEHAMLAAAMCRAAGVPSRIAVGLLYVDSPRGPAMGFHMWAEVWARGRWLPIDPTLGRGHVGATHLKISDDSWSETQSLTPLLPVLRVLGKVSVEVLRVDDGE